MWGELPSEGGASCLGASFLWGELSWGELSLGRVVLIPCFNAPGCLLNTRDFPSSSDNLRCGILKKIIQYYCYKCAIGELKLLTYFNEIYKTSNDFLKALLDVATSKIFSFYFDYVIFAFY